MNEDKKGITWYMPVTITESTEPNIQMIDIKLSYYGEIHYIRFPNGVTYKRSEDGKQYNIVNFDIYVLDK